MNPEVLEGAAYCVSCTEPTPLIYAQNLGEKKCGIWTETFLIIIGTILLTI